MSESLPNHVAIITDGNRRWAKERGLPSFVGHHEGERQMRAVLKHARRRGIPTMTVWALSTENWLKRSPDEVSYLVDLFVESLENFLKDAEAENVRLVHLGRKDRLPRVLLDAIARVEKDTRDNTQFVVNIGLDYGGRDEILRAVEKARTLTGAITEEIFSSLLDTGDQPHPDPDIIIRTGGEHRLSGYLPWQGHYAELFFENTYLPDFTPEKFDAIVADYMKRDRRFGA